jgi:hypothetical protein
MEPSATVFVYTAAGETYTFSALRQLQTVGCIKGLLAKQSGMAEGNQQLFAMHDQRDDSENLELKNRDTVSMVMDFTGQTGSPTGTPELELAVIVQSCFQEWELLIQFRDATGYLDWTRHRDGWDMLETHQDPSCCSGVSVNKTTGKVEMIALDQSNLTGYIPENIGKLKALKALLLHSNSLSGELPLDVIRLKVRDCDVTLSKNDGFSLPENVGELVDEVEEMDLSDCSLTDVANISLLTKLQWLNLARNDLTSVPKSFKALTRLRHLDITRNKMLLVPPNAPVDRDGDMHYPGLLRAQAFVANLDGDDGDDGDWLMARGLRGTRVVYGGGKARRCGSSGEVVGGSSGESPARL